MWFGRECQFDALVSLWKIGYRVEKPPSNRQANDFKWALRGRQPTHLIAFFLFSFVLSCFVGNCPSKIQEKEKKKNWAQNARSLARPMSVVARPCLTMPCTLTKTRSLARPVPVVAQPCQTPNHHTPNFFPFFFLHSSSQTSLIPQTTL